jgi:hypothetical protein
MDKLTDPPTAREIERLLRQQLANLEVHFRQQAAPIIKELVRLEAMKPPRPIWLDMALIAPDLLAQLKPAQPGQETMTDRLHRVERERNQLLHLLRLVKGAVPAYQMPVFLSDTIDQYLTDITE